MKPLIRFFSLCLLITVLLSCSGVPVKRGAAYVEPQPPSSDQAQLVVFWPDQHRVSTCCVVVKLDDIQIAYLINNTYSYKNINPGTHTIEVGEPGIVAEYIPGPKMELKFEGGRRYFVRINNPMGSTTSISMAGGIPVAYPSTEGSLELQITTEEHRWLSSTRLATEK